MMDTMEPESTKKSMLVLLSQTKRRYSLLALLLLSPTAIIDDSWLSFPLEFGCDESMVFGIDGPSCHNGGDSNIDHPTLEVDF